MGTRWLLILVGVDGDWWLMIGQLVGVALGCWVLKEAGG